MQSLSLNDLLYVLDQDDIDDGKAEDLRAAIISKVDACAVVRAEMEDEAARMRKFAKDFTDAARAAEARLERFMGYVTYAMESKGFDKLPGEKFQVALAETPGRVEIAHEPTSEDLECFPNLVRMKLEWDKSAVKDALIAGSDLRFAQIVREKYAKFGVKRGNK